MKIMRISAKNSQQTLDLLTKTMTKKNEICESFTQETKSETIVPSVSAARSRPIWPHPCGGKNCLFDTKIKWP